MEQLQRLEARISSLRDLRELIRALRALAASHVQEAQTALAGIREYVGVVEDAIAEGAALIPELADRPAGMSGARGSVLLVICTEHGFAGAFNERMLERAAAVRAPGQELVIVGNRGRTLAAETGMEVAHSLAMATHVATVPRAARRIAEYLGGVSAADMVFAAYRRGGDYEAEVRRVLPLDPALLAGAERRSPPLHHLAPATLIARLADEYLFAEITRALMESLASENGARLRVMETADRNIGDKLDVMRRSENALRQESITSELLDVVTGSEAILASATERPS